MDFAFYKEDLQKNILCKQEFSLLRVYEREMKEIIVWVDRKRKIFY